MTACTMVLALTLGCQWATGKQIYTVRTCTMGCDIRDYTLILGVIGGILYVSNDATNRSRNGIRSDWQSRTLQQVFDYVGANCSNLFHGAVWAWFECLLQVRCVLLARRRDCALQASTGHFGGCGKATRGSARCCDQKWMRHLAQLARGRLRPQGPLEGRRLQKRSKQIQLVICNPEKGLQVAGSTANPVGGR